MCLARKHFRKISEKRKASRVKQNSSQKSWKPILDRKRTSPGTGESRTRRKRSHDSDSGNDSSSSSVSKSKSSSYISSDQSTQNENSFSESGFARTENCDSQFVTSTPLIKVKSPTLTSRRVTRSSSKENVHRKRQCNPKGRPNMSKYSPVKFKRSYHRSIGTKDSDNTGAGECETDGASPKKKMKLGPHLSLGDGILTRRQLPQVNIFY